MLVVKKVKENAEVPGDVFSHLGSWSQICLAKRGRQQFQT